MPVAYRMLLLLHLSKSLPHLVDEQQLFGFKSGSQMWMLHILTLNKADTKIYGTRDDMPPYLQILWDELVESRGLYNPHEYVTQES